MTSHVVVDGSNIATEGRKLPSLAQLTEAVEQFLADRPHDLVTVICDASFPNRIDESEAKRYEQLLEEGWLITPPAGAIGRGDAFILQVAAKGGASVLSNDSFQEFHGQHAWLFDEARLVGGKPVVGVGWIFVDRVPVRGPASRKSVRDASRPEPSKPASRKRPQSKERVQKALAKDVLSDAAGNNSSGSASGVASGTGVGDGVGDKDVTESTRKRRARKAASEPSRVTDPAPGGPSSDGDGREPVNSAEAFAKFSAANPVGSEVTATIVSFGSHGAQARAGDVSCYVPLKLLGDPPPRTVKDVLTLDEERAFVVAALHDENNGVDLGLAPPKPVRRTRKKTASKKTVPKKTGAKKAASKKTVPKKTVAKKAAPKKTVPKKTASKKTVPTKTVAKKTASKKTVPKKTGVEKAAPKQTVPKKTVTRKRTLGPKSSGDETAVKRTRVKRLASPK